MRTFDANFATLKDEEFVETFWTLKIAFASPWGDQYFSDRPITVSGNVHEPIVTNWGDLSSLIDREEKQLDVSALQIEFSNFPVLSTGERISDLFDIDLETLRATVYLNFVDSAGTIYQETMFVGIVQTPIAYDYERATITIMALHEAYLNKSALRVITEQDFPFMRKTDIGSTVPIVLGTVERTPGRVVKASNSSLPTADPNNTSNARLLGFIANPNAVSQDWTIEFTSSGAEVVRNFIADTEAELGLPVGTIAFNDATDNFTNSGTNVTVSHTIAGLRPFLFVLVSMRSTTATVSAVTYGGVALTHAFTQTGSGIRHELWYLPVPASGAATVDVTVDTACAFTIIAESFNHLMLTGTNVPKHVSVVNATSVTGGSGPFFLSAKWVLDFLTATSSGTVTPGGGQVLRETEVTSLGTPSDNVRSATSTKNVNSQTWSMSWSSSAARNMLLSVWPTLQTQENWAQSFQTAASQTITGVRLRARRHPFATGTSDQLTVHIKADNAGKPADASLGTGFVQLSSSSPADVFVTFSQPISVTGATTYWLVVLAVGRDSLAQNYAMLLVARNSSSVYAGGKAIKGHQKEQGLNPAMEWDTTDRGDLFFELLFLSGTYDFRGSLSGVQGSGSYLTDSTSLDGQVTILASHWQGTPAAGDRFYFSVDSSENRVIFSESPSDTPVSEIGTVFWNDIPIIDQTKEQTTNNEGRRIGYGDGDFFSAIHGQTFTISTGFVCASVELGMAKTGAPSGEVQVEIGRRSGSTPEGEVLFTGQISMFSIQSAGTLNLGPGGYVDQNTNGAFAEVLFDDTVSLEAGSYFIRWRVSGTDTSNYVWSRRASSNTYTDGAAWNWHNDNQQWVEVGVGPGGSVTGAANPTNPRDFMFRLTAVTVNKQTSIDDGTGHNVARIGLDVAVPDDVEITADVTGLKDDVSGTYTGLASSIIRRPDHVFHRLLVLAGTPTAEIDLAGTFADSGFLYGGSYAYDGTIQDNETWKALLLRLAFEARSAFDWPVDKAQLKFLPLKVTTADRTVNFADIITRGENNRVPLIKISRSDTSKLINFVDVRYDRQARLARELTSYKKIINAQNLTSIATFGKRENPEMFFMDFVRNDGMALLDAEYYANRLSNPRRIVEVTLPFTFLDMEKDDALDFNLVKN